MRIPPDFLSKSKEPLTGLARSEGQMQPILEDEPTTDGTGIAKRKLLIPVDDSPESEKALAWAMQEIYR